MPCWLCITATAMPMVVWQKMAVVLQAITVKGIFWSGINASQSTDYVTSTPAVNVPSLPYHALAPARPTLPAKQ